MNDEPSALDRGSLTFDAASGAMFRAWFLSEVGKASESAASLIRQLLAFSRRQMIEPKVLNLNDLIENLESMLARLIGEDVDLQTSLEPDLGVVKVDPGQFEQVLVNLAVNARDAMPSGGKLVIETANVDLDATYCARHPARTTCVDAGQTSGIPRGRRITTAPNV